MTLKDFASKDKQRRGMGFQEILDRISRNMAAMEQMIVHYHPTFTQLQELLNDRYVADCLRNPTPYYDTLSRLRFSEFGIRQLLEQIGLDRAEIETRVAQDLPAQESNEPHAGQRTPEISGADGQRAIAERFTATTDE